MKKRQTLSNPEQVTSAEQLDSSAESETAQEPSGLNWLKYAGIGPARQRQRKGNQEMADKGNAGKKKLSGEAITSLGSLEAELMGLLWELGQPATSMDVMEQSLYKRRANGQEPVSFATVATTLRRLSEKGLVQSRKNARGTPVYVPTVEREEMAARILNNVSVTLLGQSLHGLLPRLLGTLKATSQGKGSKAAGDASEQAEVERLMQALEEAAQSETALGEAAGRESEAGGSSQS